MVKICIVKNATEKELAKKERMQQKGTIILDLKKMGVAAICGAMATTNLLLIHEIKCLNDEKRDVKMSLSLSKEKLANKEEEVNRLKTSLQKIKNTESSTDKIEQTEIPFMDTEDYKFEIPGTTLRVNNPVEKLSVESVDETSVLHNCSWERDGASGGSEWADEKYDAVLIIETDDSSWRYLPIKSEDTYSVNVLEVIQWKNAYLWFSEAWPKTAGVDVYDEAGLVSGKARLKEIQAAEGGSFEKIDVATFAPANDYERKIDFCITVS